jgi:DNA-binding beta-propeller fold protein YncE
MRRAAAAVVAVSLAALAQAEDPKMPAAPPPLDLVQTIALPGVQGRMDHFALDAKRGRLYLAALSNKTVEVIDVAKGARTKSLAGFAEPQGIAYLPESDRLAVACGGDGTVRILDGEKLEETASFELGSDADNVRYDAATQKLYVAYGEGAIAVLQVKRPAAQAKADIGTHPEGFQLELGGRRMFVNAAGTADVAVVDRFDMTVTARWPLGGAKKNYPMALDEAGKRLLVGCREPASVVLLSTEDGKVLSKTPCSEDPDDLFVDAKRNRVYVACGGGAVDVFERPDADHLKLLAKVETRAGARTCFFDAASDRLYVAVPNSGDKDAEIRVFAPK